jgi:hypothetical protein
MGIADEKKLQATFGLQATPAIPLLRKIAHVPRRAGRYDDAVMTMPSVQACSSESYLSQPGDFGAAE